MLVRDLFTEKEAQVHERRTLAGLGRGDLIEARLIPLDGRPLFSPAFCYHPRGRQAERGARRSTASGAARAIGY